MLRGLLRLRMNPNSLERERLCVPFDHILNQEVRAADATDLLDRRTCSVSVFDLGADEACHASGVWFET